jgi:hypothetical protein
MPSTPVSSHATRAAQSYNSGGIMGAMASLFELDPDGHLTNAMIARQALSTQVDVAADREARLTKALEDERAARAKDKRGREAEDLRASMRRLMIAGPRPVAEQQPAADEPPLIDRFAERRKAESSVEHHLHGFEHAHPAQHDRSVAPPRRRSIDELLRRPGPAPLPWWQRIGIGAPAWFKI